MGERNTIHQLQNYIVGLGPDGIAVNRMDRLNVEKSFVRIDYFVDAPESISSETTCSVDSQSANRYNGNQISRNSVRRLLNEADI